MLNTYSSYQQIARNLETSLSRVQKQPLVDRETKYYLDNITKVTSIDDFVKNDRLFKYAMKAFGLEDMSYAKAFMKKALKEGVSDPNAFANKLTDKRYAEFVRAFNFAEYGAEATVYNMAQQFATRNYATQVKIDGIDPKSEAVKAETKYYLDNIVKVKSIDGLLADDRLYKYAMKAFGLNPSTTTKETMQQMLQGGVRDANSLANKADNPRFKAFVTAYNFEALGQSATTFNAAQQPAAAKFVRQTLEEDAGQQNEGVRLALYFQRKAPTITSFYQILGDPALAKVIRTMLALPPSFAQADIDKQVKYFESRLKISDLSDPKALDKLLTRFTSMWEIDNPSTPQMASISVLFQPVEYGVSTNLMLEIQKMKR